MPLRHLLKLDNTKFRNYTRLDPDVFEELSLKPEPLITAKDTKFRREAVLSTGAADAEAPQPDCLRLPRPACTRSSHRSTLCSDKKRTPLPYSIANNCVKLTLPLLSSFYRAFICIFGKVGRIAYENVAIELMKAKCLPSLYYGLETCPLNKSQIKSLDFVLNSAFRKIFVKVICC